MNIGKTQEIITASRVLFSQFGLKKVTTDDIAREAGVSKATIYRYYRSKNQIFKQVIQDEASQLLQVIREAVESESTTSGKFRAHLLTKMSKVRELINFYRVTENSSDGYWPPIEEVRNQFMAEEMAIIKGILDEGNKSGELVVKDTDYVAKMMIVFLKAHELEWAMTGFDYSIEEYVEMMIDVMLNGIRKR